MESIERHGASATELCNTIERGKLRKSARLFKHCTVVQVACRPNGQGIDVITVMGFMGVMDCLIEPMTDNDCATHLTNHFRVITTPIDPVNALT